MKIQESRVAVASDSFFCASGGLNYLNPTDYVSLSQWFPLFGQTVLLKPQLSLSTPPKGWMPVSTEIQVVPLSIANSGRFLRIVGTRLAAEKSLRGIDLLYARMPNYEGYWVFQVAQRLRIPLLLELHGDWVSSITEEDQQDLLRRMTRSWRARFTDRATMRMAEYASAIVTIGSELKEKYAPVYTPTLVSTNHLLPASFYCPREDFRLKDTPLILFVGDIQRRKGLLVLFEALRDLKSHGRLFQMVLVGDGLLEYELRAYAEQEGFIDRVIFAGRVPHGPELFAWFKKADVLVLPSIAAEGVPRVTHEAMAFGCPIIATDIGSVAWQLEGGAGIVVQPRNASVLANAICEVLDNGELRRSLSEKGYRRAQDYTLEKQQATLTEFVSKNFI